MRRRPFALAFVFLAPACSSERTKDAPKATAAAPLEVLRGFRGLASRLEGLAPFYREGAFRVPAAAPRSTGVGWVDARDLVHLDLALPPRSGRALRVGVSNTHWLDVTAEGDREVDGVPAAHGLEFREVRPHHDLVLIADTRHVEELRVLRAPARVELRYRVRLGPDLVSLRVREGFVEALDAQGVSRLRSDPWVVIDSDHHTATVVPALRGEGKQWVLTATIDASGMTAPIAIDPGWGSPGNMAIGRQYATATSLASGKVLVVGGNTTGSGLTSSAELFDPATNTFTIATSMSVARAEHTATRLASGKVLVAGGGAAELYDPSADTWSAAGTMVTARTAHTSVLLSPSGKVLAAGGLPGPLSTGEVWDPATNTWTAVTNGMSSNHRAAVGGPFGTDKALVTGGWPGYGAVSNAEVYDAALNKFTATPKMTVDREQMSGTVLADGRILIAGGEYYPGAWTWRSTAEVWIPAAGAFGPVAPMPGNRMGQIASRLTSGKVLLTGSATTPIVASLLYDPTADAWTAVGTPVSAHYRGAGEALPAERALVVGGAPGTDLSVYGNVAEVWGDAAASGSACLAGAQCASGFCADGVCCDRACSGSCEACAEAGSVGTCKLVTGAPRAKRTACVGTGTCGGSCDGTLVGCTYPSVSVSCKPASCVGGSAVATAYCDGAGACGATPAAVACGLFTCGLTACKTTCATDADCVSTAYCDGTVCALRKKTGEACAGASACVSGFCADGVCCDSACADGCTSCKLSGSVGTCGPVDSGDDPHGKCAGGTCAICDKGKCATKPGCADAGPADAGADGGRPLADAPAPNPGAKPTVGGFQRCAHDKECSAGHCVEGVCCDTPCTERCHSCALLSSPGKCTLEPTGVDLKNECGAALQCVGTCGPGGECVGAAAGTMCARNRCTGPSAGVGPGYCSAPGGTCGVEDTIAFECTPYACEPAFGACRTECVTSEDCARGFTCDTAAKLCVADAPPADNSGCAMSAGGARSSAGALFAAWALAAIVSGRGRASHRRPIRRPR